MFLCATKGLQSDYEEQFQHAEVLSARADLGSQLRLAVWTGWRAGHIERTFDHMIKLGLATLWWDLWTQWLLGLEVTVARIPLIGSRLCRLV